MNQAPIMQAFVSIAHEAGQEIMKIYAGNRTSSAKADGSPLTAADLAANACILRRLEAEVPGIPFITEEAAEIALPPGCTRFILIDPLDGTKEFISGSGEFTVNLALIEDGQAVCGVVYAPALGRMWAGARGLGAERLSYTSPDSGAAPVREAIMARPAPAEGLVAVASRSHSDAATDAFLAGLPVVERRSIGSSLKFCLVAEGSADVYPRFGPTMEWDTAAGQAVLAAAGGSVTTPEGHPFHYGKREAQFRNGAFIAWGAR